MPDLTSPWVYFVGGALLVDLAALASIWRGPHHSAKAKIVWTLIVAVLPVLGAVAWLALARDRRR
jgi:hypothetical protein